MKTTKVDIAKYFGITAMTLTNYENLAKKGSVEHQRKLDAYREFYIREQIKKEPRVKVLRDEKDSDTYYLFKD